jgi:iron complex transport system substrate-binding protein
MIRKSNTILAAAGLFCAGLICSIIWLGGFSHKAVFSKDVHEFAFAGPSLPARVVSMAPNITETVYALGEQDRLVGVTRFCVYPQEATTLPKVGGFYNPNLERLIALRPDLVLLQGRHKKVARFCETRDIPILRVDMDSLLTIYEGVEKLGSAFGVPGQAKLLCDRIRNDLDDIRRRVQDKQRPAVFISLGRTMGSMINLYTVGGSSFVSQVLDVAGGRNIFDDVNLPYPEVSKESLIARAPDIILEIYANEEISDGQENRILEEWQAFPGVPAVVNERIHVMTEDFLLVPGPRVVQAARAFADRIHGGLNGR